MGYQVKWVIDNLGITRRTLRVFEEAGLMRKNENNQYRNYNEADIDRIWTIRVLQGMGYSIKEIVAMSKDEEFDFADSIGKKIEDLEEEKEKIERHLGYAKMVKLTGRLPIRPKNMGEVKCEEFQNDVVEKWNIMNDTKGGEYEKLVKTLLSQPEEETASGDLQTLFSGFGDSLGEIFSLDIDYLLMEYVLPKAIVKRRDLGANHLQIRFMFKMIYDNLKQKIKEIDPEISKEMSIKQFAHYYSSSYMAGDVAKLKGLEFTKEECEFIANAVSVFAGYKNYNELLEDELHGKE